VPSIKAVKDKVIRSSISRLSSTELCSYLSYRLVELINRENIVSYDELLYRFCEVGPGNLRFDPLTVEAFLESKLCEDLFAKKSIERTEGWICFKTDGAGKISARMKRKISDGIEKSVYSKECLKALKKDVLKVIEGAGYGILSSIINDKKHYLEILLISSQPKRRILLRFYNSNEWIYPFSGQIWKLFKEAGNKECIPVLVAPRIHGSCFPLFKAIGILARSTYGLFSMKSSDEIKESVLNTDERELLSIRNITVGKIYCLSRGEADQYLECLRQLLEIAIPAYFEPCKIKVGITQKKLSRLPQDVVVNFSGFQGSKQNVKEKISSIESILTLKLGHLNPLQALVKKLNALIEQPG